MSAPRWFRLEDVALSALAITLMLAVAAPAAHAGVLYSTGFENPPFTLGNISGQDGWSVFGPGTALVENTVVQSGLQAVSMDGSTARQVAGLGSGLAPLLGGIDILGNGQIDAIAAGFPVVGTFTYNAWNNVSFLFNINTQMYSFSLNGVVLASSIPFCGDDGPCAGAHVSSYGAGVFDSFSGGNDTGYIDNYSAVANPIPEPSGIALFGTGVVGLAGVLRRKLRL